MKRILLVEDNAAHRKLLRDHLRRAGYEVREASEAGQGLVGAAADSDLVVMDVQLPGLDGIAATRLLRKHRQTAHVPVVVVTAHAMRGDEGRVMAAGACAYVTKPIDYRQLLRVVADCLNQTSATAAAGD